MESLPNALFPSQTSFIQMEECSLEPEKQNDPCPPPECHLCSFLEVENPGGSLKNTRGVMAWSHFWLEIAKSNDPYTMNYDNKRYCSFYLTPKPTSATNLHTI